MEIQRLCVAEEFVAGYHVIIVPRTSHSQVFDHLQMEKAWEIFVWLIWMVGKPVKNLEVFLPASVCCCFTTKEYVFGENTSVWVL